MKTYTCKHCNKEFKDYISDHRVYCGKSCKHKHQDTFKGENNPKWSGGEIEKKCLVCDKDFTVKNYRKDTAKFCSHECCDIDRDEGKSTLYKRIRKSKEYRLWREAVFERDDYTCVFCGDIGGSLNADHIKRFSDYPELRFAIDNGRTLCVDCHKKTGTYGRPRPISVEEA